LDGVSYMISLWMENGDALTYVQKNPSASRLNLLVQAAKGLQYLHNFDPPVIHSDLKGANIFISKTGNVYIADFGLSEHVIRDNAVEHSSAWHNGGNPRWQAPEILDAETREDARRAIKTDIFAFGRVMLEFFTGQAPFSDIWQPTHVAQKVVRGDFPERPRDDDIIARGLDDNMWGLMIKCWDMNPSLRPTAADILSRLQSALDLEGTISTTKDS